MVTPLFLGVMTVLIPCGITQAMLAAWAWALAILSWELRSCFPSPLFAKQYRFFSRPGLGRRKNTS
jgi:hypothetical protein